MTNTLNVIAESRRFGNELKDLLNATVCTGITITSVVSDELHPRTIVGYKITKQDQDLRWGLPLTINASPARIFLGLSFRLEADVERDYLMVASSAMILSLDPELQQDKVLLHYDYERSKPDGYPEAHLQVCATSDHWEACRRVDGSARALKKLHLPVGPRRFRPSVEDLIEFLIVEKLVAGRPGWQEAVNSGREAFRIRQLRAAIRRDPDTALAVLRAEGLLGGAA